ncbi:serine/threonine-protein kinase S6KL [Toxorhynchites rutilus septentrionalis]|uniref:serine/threonine-protein kinase S6KL n=1 Tax=Toxorhynchites rutilus septentrionalis TaxID=329112 RepID=UPI00247B14D0|nr:serine/threonine-protein kinase S6KL [Toxorhynchites rutilus septentrionalis]
MGNTNSGNTIQRKEISTAKSSSSSSSLSSVSAASLLVATTGASRKGTQNTRQIQRSASLGDFFNRINDSFIRLSTSLSCTALSPVSSSSGPSGNHCRSRPWSRFSRKRWHEATLSNKFQLSKGCWPVTNVEAIFLPQIPVDYQAVREYTFEEHIADGAFGKVYRVIGQTVASGANPAQVYALKILSKAQIISTNALAQLKDEVNIQTVCGHHPFLARCISHWQNKKQIFLLCQFYPNGELFQKFSRFPHELVRLYVAEIALALDFLHQAGIIYRDLKPENILLDWDYHVRLIDFGLSKWLSIGTRTRTLCGTLQLMAPEILAGETYGHSVDWWALGALACRMCTGFYPQLDISAYLNKSEEIDTLIKNISNGRKFASAKLLPDSTARLPVEIQDLLKRLLETKPQYRLRSVLQLQRIALYKNYNWDAVRNKQVCPKKIIEAEIDMEKPSDGHSSVMRSDEFLDFDW